MSAEIINLNKVRKAKAKTDKEKQAAENRVLHGLNKTEKTLLKHEAEKRRKLQEGHKLHDDDSPGSK